MKIFRSHLTVGYIAIAVLALIGTWINNLQYLPLGVFQVLPQFFDDSLASAGSRSLTIDLVFLTLAVCIWMVCEARRLKMRGVWWYIFFGMTIAISVTAPLFLAQRERALGAGGSKTPVGAADLAGLALLTVAALAYAGAGVLRVW
jgi:hypothetical protein